MDTNFQTSFIPKKPLAEERVVAPKHTSLFAFVATLVFFAALAAAGAVYFYKASLEKDIVSMDAQLAAARNAFEPSLITTLKTLDRRMTDANLLLTNHVAVSPIFAALQQHTLKSIQFTKFSYSTEADPSAPVTVRMSGKARDYASIALQSDSFAKNRNIHNSIFSNLTLDQTTGLVGFDLVFTVDAELVRFMSHLDSYVSQEGTAVTVPAAADQTAPSSGAVQAPSGAPTTSTAPAAPTQPADNPSARSFLPAGLQ